MQTRVAQLESFPTPAGSPAPSVSGGDGAQSPLPRSFADVARGSGGTGSPGAMFAQFSPSVVATPPAFALRSNMLSNDWDRDTDPSILKMQTKELIADKEFKKLALEVLHVAGINVDSVELEISLLAKDAKIRFKGDERTFRRAVKQVQDSFRTADRTYTRHTVTSGVS